MIPEDNREYIALLEKHGEAVTIKQQVDWDLEAGAITRRACELVAPAPFMENIKDYPGWRFFGAPFSSFKRTAIAMGMDPSSSYESILDEFDERQQKPIKPVKVKSGPCQENVISGDKVDLSLLPSPMVHDGDGGRYLGTWHTVVSKDPDTNSVNWGIYRQMVVDERTMNGLVNAKTDLGRVFYQKYAPQNKPMPFATVITPDPLSAASSTISSAVDEVEVAGGLRQKPVELVKCKTVDLEVPAQSEIVLEGEIIPGTSIPEGPFGEYIGYRVGPRMPRMVFKINMITHRDNAIIGISNAGMPVEEAAVLLACTWRSTVKQILEAQQIPITGVNLPPECAMNTAVVGVKGTHTGIANQVANVIWGKSGFPTLYMNNIIVVDEDVNVYDLKEVVHSLFTKCHPKNGIRIQEESAMQQTIPWMSKEDKKFGRGVKTLYDCTWPVTWAKEDIPPKMAFTSSYPQQMQDHVLSNWRKYGYK